MSTNKPTKPDVVTVSPEDDKSQLIKLLKESVESKDKEIEKLKIDRDQANGATEKKEVLIDNLNKLIDQIIDRVRDQCETIELSSANIISIRRELQVMKAQAQRNPETLKQYLSEVQAQTEGGSPNAQQRAGNKDT